LCALQRLRRFLLHCTFLQQQRNAPFTRVEAMLDPPGSRQSPLHRGASLRFSQAVVAGSWPQRAVLRLVLTELAEWGRVNDMHVRRLRTIVES